jgi:hypothetical protein
MTNLSNDLPSPADRSTPSSPPTERARVQGTAASQHSEPRPESLPHGTTKDQIAEMESEGQAQKQGNDIDPATPDGREGATDEEVGDRTGPGAGYDMEPEQDKDRGGVA